MFSEHKALIREKKFRPGLISEGRKRGHQFDATLTDDHTLFLLNQQREMSSRNEKRSWLSRLLRRR
ncbi:MAG: hypothetical protein HRU46_02090 [Verrucomicrobiales bacterium]|nr:hypothetical protein [Verrucomicrobiales bacterium]